MSRGASRINPPKRPEPERTAKGAVQSKTGLADKSKSYWAHHHESMRNSFARLLSTPAQSLMTALVVAIALALPASLLIALDNLQQLDKSWDASPKISVFLKPRASEVSITQLKGRIETMPQVSEVVVLTADQALAEFQELSGFGEALSALDDNPLPTTLIVAPTTSGAEPAQIEILGKAIAAEGIVDEVSLDMAWVRRLGEIMRLGRQVVVTLAILLGVGVLLAIGNTVRLAIENRKEEIVVTKLVGGTDPFVRRPFIYTGAWYGFLGGLLACIIVSASFWLVQDTIERLALLYQSNFVFRGLGPLAGLKLLCLATLLGWLGAWIAVGRHLSLIEPK